METGRPVDTLSHPDRLIAFAAGMRASFGVRARAVAVGQADGARASALPSVDAWLSVVRTLDGEAGSA